MQVFNQLVCFLVAYGAVMLINHWNNSSKEVVDSSSCEAFWNEEDVFLEDVTAVWSGAYAL